MRNNRALLLALIAPLGTYALAQYAPFPALPANQYEVLTRGPVHEAFAEPVNLQVQPGLIINKQPPAGVQEVPPAERPQGNFTWIPGYWSFDAEQNTFVWISACWRAAPPNHYWVPGYWATVTEMARERRGGVDVNLNGLDLRIGGRDRDAARVAGWQWVPGFWNEFDDDPGLDYVAEPPAPFDLEPPGAAPAPDVTWIPGCWQYDDGRYIKRPGYWLRQNADWVWSPANYHWTPRGYVFVDGYWDYPLDRRGVLFAPVALTPAQYSQPGFVYSPTIAIDIDILRTDMFVYPRYSHYYFGDYYDDAYQRAGIFSTVIVQRDRSYYDPIYTYDRWHYGQRDRDWERRRREEYQQRHDDRDRRPARTYREMETRVARLPERDRRQAEVAAPVATYAASRSGTLRFEQLKNDDRKAIAQRAADTTKLRDDRGKWESQRSSTPAPDRREDRRDQTTTPPVRTPTPVAPAPTPAPDRRDERRDDRRDVTPIPPTRTPAPVAPAPAPTPAPTDRRDDRRDVTPTPRPPAPVAPAPVAPAPAPTAAPAPTPAPPAADPAQPGNRGERVRVPVTRPPAPAAQPDKGPPPRPSEERSNRDKREKDSPRANDNAPKDKDSKDNKDKGKDNK